MQGNQTEPRLNQEGLEREKALLKSENNRLTAELHQQIQSTQLLKQQHEDVLECMKLECEIAVLEKEEALSEAAKVAANLKQQLVEATAALESARAEATRERDAKFALQTQLESLQAQSNTLQALHTEELHLLQLDHQSRLDQQTNTHQSELCRKDNDHSRFVQDLVRKFEDRISRLQEDYEDHTRKLRRRCEDLERERGRKNQAGTGSDDARAGDKPSIKPQQNQQSKTSTPPACSQPKPGASSVSDDAVLHPTSSDKAGGTDSGQRHVVYLDGLHMFMPRVPHVDVMHTMSSPGPVTPVYETCDALIQARKTDDEHSKQHDSTQQRQGPVVLSQVPPGADNHVTTACPANVTCDMSSLGTVTAPPLGTMMKPRPANEHDVGMQPDQQPQVVLAEHLHDPGQTGSAVVADLVRADQRQAGSARSEVQEVAMHLAPRQHGADIVTSAAREGKDTDWNVSASKQVPMLKGPGNARTKDPCDTVNATAALLFDLIMQRVPGPSGEQAGAQTCMDSTVEVRLAARSDGHVSVDIRVGQHSTSVSAGLPVKDASHLSTAPTNSSQIDSPNCGNGDKKAEDVKHVQSKVRHSSTGDAHPDLSSTPNKNARKSTRHHAQSNKSPDRGRAGQCRPEPSHRYVSTSRSTRSSSQDRSRDRSKDRSGRRDRDTRHADHKRRRSASPSKKRDRKGGASESGRRHLPSREPSRRDASRSPSRRRSLDEAVWRWRSHSREDRRRSDDVRYSRKRSRSPIDVSRPGTMSTRPSVRQLAVEIDHLKRQRTVACTDRTLRPAEVHGVDGSKDVYTTSSAFVASGLPMRRAIATGQSKGERQAGAHDTIRNGCIRQPQERSALPPRSPVRPRINPALPVSLDAVLEMRRRELAELENMLEMQKFGTARVSRRSVATTISARGRHDNYMTRVDFSWRETNDGVCQAGLDDSEEAADVAAGAPVASREAIQEAFDQWLHDQYPDDQGGGNAAVRHAMLLLFDVGISSQPFKSMGSRTLGKALATDMHHAFNEAGRLKGIRETLVNSGLVSLRSYKGQKEQLVVLDYQSLICQLHDDGYLEG